MSINVQTGVDGTKVAYFPIESARFAFQRDLEKFDPNIKVPVQTDTVCLRKALADYVRPTTNKDKGVSIKGLKKPKQNGTEVVYVHKDEHANEYRRSFAAKVGKLPNGDTKIVADDYMVDTDILEENFHQHKDRVPTGTIRKVFDSILEGMGGWKLLTGLWYFPEHLHAKLNTFTPIMEDYSEVFCMNVSLDEGTIGFVLNRVKAKLLDDAKQIRDLVYNGDIKDKQVQNAHLKAAQLRRQLDELSQNLGESLESFQDMLADAVKLEPVANDVSLGAEIGLFD